MSVGSISGGSAYITGITQAQRQAQLKAQGKPQVQAGVTGTKNADGDNDGTTVAQAAAEKNGATVDVNG